MIADKRPGYLRPVPAGGSSAANFYETEVDAKVKALLVLVCGAIRLP